VRVPAAQDLTAGQQRLFRRLGVHPGIDIDAYAAAGLDGTGPEEARRHLDGLYEHYLLTEPARGRYRLHDLLREHARALSSAGDAADADAAAGRLLDYYLHTAAAAGQHIESRITAVARPLPGEPPAVAVPLAAVGQAAAWLEVERVNLHAAAGYAAASGRPGHAIAIPAVIGGFLFARGHWDQSAALHRGALAAARQAGDRAGQADALNELGVLQRVSGDCPAATTSYQQALVIFRDIGHRLGQALATGNAALVHMRTGDYPSAVASLTEALDMYRNLGHREGQAETLNDLGETLSRSGDGQHARDHHARALAIAREISVPVEEARALEGLGHCLLSDGDQEGASLHWQQALAICQRIGVPDAQRIQETLLRHGTTPAV
jgi:tetratricopeptide (TPR) repeat protein